MSKKRKKSALFKPFRYLVRLCYTKMKVEGLENLPDEACIIVANHAQIHGPLACELYLTDNFYTWCASQMMSLKEVPKYAYQDFWSEKPKALRPFFKLLAYIIAPLSVFIFNNARTIPVYRDSHILTTFKETVSKLADGKNVVIFPEHNKKYNNIVYDFQEGFTDVARLYYKRTEKEISFVPLYVAPKMKKMYLGKPVKFLSSAPKDEERSRICDYLKNEITDIAKRLPMHTVIPYRNIKKKLYPKNTDKGA